MNQTTAPTRSLIMKRTFKAPRLRVFAAWTEPEILREWFAPPPGWTTPEAEVDLRVGGAYRFAFQAPDGERNEVSGVFCEVQPPDRLSYTWRFPGFPSDTLLTVEFFDRGDETELVLTHQNFADDEACEEHKRGWAMSLENLARTV